MGVGRGEANHEPTLRCTTQVLHAHLHCAHHGQPPQQGAQREAQTPAQRSLLHPHGEGEQIDQRLLDKVGQPRLR